MKGLFKLREWLTMLEAAQHLSIMFGEEVGEADVLRLALDGHLKLSVNFVNPACVRIGKLISWDDKDGLPPDLVSIFAKLPEEGRDAWINLMKNQGPFGDYCLDLEERVTSVEGIWDLHLFGSVRRGLEHKYQLLTGGPAVEMTGAEGSYIEREAGKACQLYESFYEVFGKSKKEPDEENENIKGSLAQLQKIETARANKTIDKAKANELLGQHSIDRRDFLAARKKHFSDEYFPASGLPDDSVFVVRTQALIDLQERLSPVDSDKGTLLDGRAETTYLNIIGAMLETFVHKDHGDVNFPSETKLREFLSAKYAGFKGLTERTLAEKFAAAKRALNDDMG